MDLGGYSLKGPREANEDNYYVRDFPDDISFSNGVCAFIMISDGMGGYQGGDVASSLAVTAAESYLNQLFDMARGNFVDFDANVALGEIVQNSHEAILLEAQRRGGGSIGATFVGAFLSKTHAWIGHVGDSRAYLMRRGDAIQITEDHSQVGRMLSRGLITEEEAQNHPARNRIERALGFSDAQIELDEVDLGDADAILLCSDGAYTVLGGMEMYEVMSSGSDARSSAKRVAKQAIRAGTDDNTTVVVATSFQGAFGNQKVPGTVVSNNARSSKTGTLTGAEGVKLPPNAHRSTAREVRARNASRNASRSQRRRRQAPAHSRARRSFSWKAILPILLFVVLLAVMVVVGTRACSQPSSSEVASSSPSAAQTTQGTAAPSTSAPQTDTMTTYTVNDNSGANGAVLKYVSHGMAYRFTEEQFGIMGSEPTVNNGTAIVASTNAQPYGHPDKSYRRLDEKYFNALKADFANYKRDGNADFDNSPLSQVLGRSAYIEFLDKLSSVEDASIDGTVSFLVLDSGAVTENTGQ